ncbi:hypothetical protein [Flavobacterium ginsenosidimutans]|uniref:hypothetical protein n=1 Tax=Flavobacterium ginsenosidimutans TaxID=687844 RepID=UPI003D97173B
MLLIIFEGFSQVNKRYGTCILFLREMELSVSTVFDLAKDYGFLICSELQIDLLNDVACINDQGEINLAYQDCLKKGHFFKCIPEAGFDSAFHIEIPRFTEEDFKEAIVKLGGKKIDEGKAKTPDFLLGTVAVELKDLQNESLYNTERQKSISQLFEKLDNYSVSINPSELDKESFEAYKRIISNSIKSVLKKASVQVKSFKLLTEISSAGVIVINTGFFSLSHELFKNIVEDIIEYQTNTLEFAYIFTQKVWGNAIGDGEVNYYHDFIGNVPDNFKEIETVVDGMIDQKMGAIFRKPLQANPVQVQEPISFLVNDKIFYWTPRKVKPSWESK